MVVRSVYTNLILKSTNTYKIFLLTQFTKNVTKILSSFHWENLTVQLGQFAAFLDTSNISLTKLFESLVNFEKNQSQKCCCAK